LNNSQNHTHNQGPSAARCIVLTTYHNITTDIILSCTWVEVNVKQENLIHGW
jgi:hypothetical protein